MSYDVKLGHGVLIYDPFFFPGIWFYFCQEGQKLMNYLLRSDIYEKSCFIGVSVVVIVYICIKYRGSERSS